MGAGVVGALGWEFLLGNHAVSTSLPRGPVWGFSAFNSGAGAGLWEGLRAGTPPAPAPGWGSDSPLSHQGAPLLFQCF